jgi:hypothetical protein
VVSNNGIDTGGMSNILREFTSETCIQMYSQSLGFRRYVLGDLGEPPVGAVGGGSRADATPGTPERREG